MIFKPFLLVLLASDVALSGSTYRAAVVEFSVDQASNERVMNNLNGFKDALNQITTLGGAQIVVFPEDAIIGQSYTTRESIYPFLEHIPDVSSLNGSINPCTQSDFDDRPILRNLSCLARQFSAVLVANMGDVQNCEGKEQCPSDGRYQFNTNVVFESDGMLIAKYHKQNLYAMENKYFDSGEQSSCTTFTTSFGVVFGTLTCYDLLYNQPRNCLLKKGLENFVLPTTWGNNFPFYVSIGVQQSWSLKHSVNLLAANQYFVYDSSYFSSGSGIYSSGYAKYFIGSFNPGEAVRKVVISDLPVVPSPSSGIRHHGSVLNVSNIMMRTSKYLTFKLLTKRKGVIRVSSSEDKYLNRSLDCRLKYSIRSYKRNELYAVGAYIGVPPRDSTFGYAVCALLRCSSADHCGYPVDGHAASTVFKKVKLYGTFPASSTVYASALQSGLKLLDPSLMKVRRKGLFISGNAQPLLSASLWARVVPDSFLVSELN